MDPDLARLMTLAKTDLAEAGRQLMALVKRERPDQNALSRNEYRMMERWWNNDFDDEIDHLTGSETIALLNAWFKLDRGRV